MSVDIDFQSICIVYSNLYLLLMKIKFKNIALGVFIIGLMGGVFLVFEWKTNKPIYIAKINTFLQENVHKGASIGNIYFWMDCKDRTVLFRIDSLRLKDENFTIHKIEALKIDTLYVDISLTKLLKRKLKLDYVHIKGGNFYLFDLKNGWSNLAVFNFVPKNKRTANTDKEAWAFEIDKLILENFKLTIEPEKIGKKFDFYVKRIEAEPQRIKTPMTFPTQLDIVIKQLLFKKQQGAFLRNAIVLSSPKVKLTDSSLSFEPTSFLVNNIPYLVEAKFGLTRQYDSLYLNISTEEALYDSTIILLSNSIERKLKNFSFKSKIRANASIYGSMNDTTPRVIVNFISQNNQAVLPYLKLNEVNFAGYFCNQVDKNLKPSDANSIIYFDSLKGKDIYTEVNISSTHLTNLEYPRLQTQLGMQGDVRGLKKFAVNKDFDLLSGEYELHGEYNNDFDLTLEKLFNVKGYFKLKNIHAIITKYNYELKNINAIAHYKQKEFLVDSFRFLMLDIKNKQRNFKFNAIHSRFRFDKKNNYFLNTNFKAETQPLLFKPIADKYGWNVGGGTIWVEGTYDDKLYFNVKDIPNFRGKVVLSQVDMGMRKYNVNIENTDGIFEIDKDRFKTNDFSTKIYYIDYPQEENKVLLRIDNSYGKMANIPDIHCDFSIEGKVKAFNPLIKKQFLNLEQGDVTIKGKYNGLFHSRFEDIQNLNLSLNMNEVKLYLNALQTSFSNINGKVLIDKNIIQIPKLSLLYDIYPIEINLYSKDAVEYWFDKTQQSHTYLKVYSPKIGLGSSQHIVDNALAKAKNTASSQSSTSLEKMIQEYRNYENVYGDLDIKFDTLLYKNYQLKNLDIKLKKETDQTTLHYGSLEFAGGYVGGYGRMTSLGHIHKLYGIAKMDGIKLEGIQKEYNDVIPDVFCQLNMRGDLSAFNQFEKIIVDTLEQSMWCGFNLYSDVQVSPIRIIHPNSILNLKPRKFFNKLLDTIHIEPIQFKIFNQDQYLNIPLAGIRSNLADIWFSAEGNWDEKMDISLKIPHYNLSNFLFGKNKSHSHFSTVRHHAELNLKLYPNLKHPLNIERSKKTELYFRLKGK